jgi:hypothetical protein
MECVFIYTAHPAQKVCGQHLLDHPKTAPACPVQLILDPHSLSFPLLPQTHPPLLEPPLPDTPHAPSCLQCLCIVCANCPHTLPLQDSNSLMNIPALFSSFCCAPEALTQSSLQSTCYVPVTNTSPHLGRSSFPFDRFRN